MAGLETLFLRSVSRRAQTAHCGRGRQPALGPTRGRGLAAHRTVELRDLGRGGLGRARQTTRANRRRRGPDQSLLHQISFRVLEAWDRRVYPDVQALIAPVDCADMFARVPNLPAERAEPSGALAFPSARMAALQGLNPDVILHCAPGPVPEALGAFARFGVWSIHLGDPSEPRSATPCFSEVRDGRLLSSAALLMHGGPSGGVHLLTHARVATEHSLFRSKNCVRPTLTALTFVIRKLYELHQRGWDRFAQDLVAVLPASKGEPVGHHHPRNRDMVKFLVPRIGRRLVNLVRRPSLNFCWRIALRSGYPQKLVEDGSGKGWRLSAGCSRRRAGTLPIPSCCGARADCGCSVKR